MTLDEIRWMTELFRTQNMSKAAETLFVSQPALSQCVKRIEAQLGFPLFERSNKGLVPTEKGLLFSRAAQDITGCYQQFCARWSCWTTPSCARSSLAWLPFSAPAALPTSCVSCKQPVPRYSFPSMRQIWTIFWRR